MKEKRRDEMIGQDGGIEKRKLDEKKGDEGKEKQK